MAQKYVSMAVIQILSLIYYFMVHAYYYQTVPAVCNTHVVVFIYEFYYIILVLDFSCYLNIHIPLSLVRSYSAIRVHFNEFIFGNLCPSKVTCISILTHMCLILYCSTESCFQSLMLIVSYYCYVMRISSQ